MILKHKTSGKNKSTDRDIFSIDVTRSSSLGIVVICSGDDGGTCMR